MAGTEQWNWNYVWNTAKATTRLRREWSEPFFSFNLFAGIKNNLRLKVKCSAPSKMNLRVRQMALSPSFLLALFVYIGNYQTILSLHCSLECRNASPLTHFHHSLLPLRWSSLPPSPLSFFLLSVIPQLLKSTKQCWIPNLWNSLSTQHWYEKYINQINLLNKAIQTGTLHRNRKLFNLIFNLI